MNDEKLFSITISTDAFNGALIDELLPSIDLYPSSYFDRDDDVARLNLYYEDQSECDSVHQIIKETFNTWVDLAGLDLNKIDLIKGDLIKEDWSEKWKEFFHVEKISERLVIKPSWEEYNPTASDIVIEIDPGMSFGTGNHGTTKACLQLLDELTKDIQDSFLDMGCGSGILSIAASKLGIATINGFDYDENSVRIANENVTLAGCTNIDLTLQNLYEYEPVQKYTLVIANILAPVLIDNAERIFSSLNPSANSRLVLSGILHEQFPQVMKTFEKSGLQLIDHRKIDKWSTGLFKIAHL